MTIKEILTSLEGANPNIRVYFSFCRCVPTGVDSWRGSYDEPAIGWEPTGYSSNITIKEYPSVESFKETLKECLSNTYFGWKGGEYRYHEDLTLHVDNPGDCTNTEITKVEVKEFEVILHAETTE